MTPLYTIEYLQKSHIEIYKKCFSNTLWRNLYGVNDPCFDIDDFIEKAVLTNYPSVERIVIINNKSIPVFFAHICCENEICTIVAGVIPELMNSGKGIYCSVIVLNYIFKNKKASLLKVNILKSNLISLRMVMKFGFKIILSANCDNTEINCLHLKKHDFPNSFSIELLKRIKNDEK